MGGACDGCMEDGHVLMVEDEMNVVDFENCFSVQEISQSLPLKSVNTWPCHDRGRR